jgi:hypothetical protein
LQRQQRFSVIRSRTHSATRTTRLRRLDG